MIGMKLFNIMVRLSFVFAIATYFFPYHIISNFSRILSVHIIIYIWTILVICFGFYLKGKRKPYILVGLLLIPFFILFKEYISILFVTIIVVSIYFYLYKYEGIDTVVFTTEEFKRGLTVFMIMIFFSFLTETISYINKNSGLFMIIYFLSGVVLLRSLRHLEHNRDMKEINRQNLKYFIGIIIFSIIGSSEKLLNGILLIFKNIYIALAEILSKVFHWFIIGVAYLVVFIIDIFKKRFSSNNIEEIKPQESEQISEEILEITTKGISPTIKLIFEIVFKIFLIGIVLYIIWRMFKETKQKSSEKEGYVEEKEFIKINRKKSRRKLLIPKKGKELIRYYYIKFLNKCMENNITIKKHNTTEEINDKAETLYDSEVLKEFRNIYIDTRYGNKEVDKKDIKKYKANYKKLK
ncbi:hypothetical protein KQH90_10065 [Anaerosalibacter bizertensis]|uniref:hypothetical protein n=1 Tax=Anaerosalibacter bizertensis TaxID=932217 RepID=UPI001C0F0712|nr:hypothetical protein [Anaerosalibacter bizertensis]MBU5294373.1 hypothetical protein [Anaerosalibacter bizertensis]